MRAHLGGCLVCGCALTVSELSRAVSLHSQLEITLILVKEWMNCNAFGSFDASSSNAISNLVSSWHLSSFSCAARLITDLFHGPTLLPTPSAPPA